MSAPDVTPNWLQRLPRSVRFVIGLPAQTLLLLIRIYQRTLSPVLPVVFGSACGCRFSPTCSHYAAEAIRVHGALVGTLLTIYGRMRATAPLSATK